MKNPMATIFFEQPPQRISALPKASNGVFGDRESMDEVRGQNAELPPLSDKQSLRWWLSLIVTPPDLKDHVTAARGP